MKMINYIMIVFVAGLLSSCDDPMGPPDPPVKKEIYALQWATRMDEDKEIVGSDYTQHYGDWLLATGDIGDPFTIFAFNKLTGDKDWTFNNNGVVNDEILVSQLIDNVYIGITNKGMVGVNIETQMRIWETKFQDFNYESNNGNTVLTGYLYHNFSVGGVGLNSEAAAILKINIATGTFEEIYRIENDTQGLKASSPPIVYTDGNGDDIMIFNLYPDSDKSPTMDSQNLIAYNITKDTKLWETENFTQSFYSNSLHPPIIYNNIVITGGDWSIYAFDITTGAQLWRRPVPNYDKFGIWTNTNHLLKNDRLYVNNGGPEIMCLDPIDGSIIWINSTDASNCTDNMIYYEKEDYLVYTSWGDGSVYLLDALTGEKIHREHRYDDSSFNNDVVYDLEMDMFFTSTYKHAIGFKINAPE